jgi:hypothetical protein
MKNVNFAIKLIKRGRNFFNKKRRINTLNHKTNFKFKKIKKIKLNKNKLIYLVKNCRIFSSSNFLFDKNNNIIKESIDYYTRDYSILKANKILTIETCALNLCNLNHNNYYHFIIDILYKLFIFKKLKIKDYRIIFLKKDFVSYRKELFNFFFPAEVKKLLLVDSKTQIECNIAYHINSNFEYNYSGHYEYIKFLKNKIDYSKKIKKSKKKLKVYVSRKIAGYRGFENEQVLIKLLKNKGFKIFDFEKINILNQFKIFKNSEMILTCHGSALTNLIACDKQIKVVEIHSEYMTDNYTKLSKLIGAKNHFNYLMRKDNPFIHFEENTITKNKNKYIDKNNLRDLKFIIEQN